MQDEQLLDLLALTDNRQPKPVAPCVRRRGCNRLADQPRDGLLDSRGDTMSKPTIDKLEFPELSRRIAEGLGWTGFAGNLPKHAWAERRLIAIPPGKEIQEFIPNFASLDVLVEARNAWGKAQTPMWFWNDGTCTEDFHSNGEALTIGVKRTSVESFAPTPALAIARAFLKALEKRLKNENPI